jgi:hypothetical protein
VAEPDDRPSSKPLPDVVADLPAHAVRLAAAFRQHGDSTGRKWSAKVRHRVPAGDAGSHAEILSVRVDLTSADADALADVLHGAAELAAGPGRRGPNWAWIGSDQAAQLVGVEPSTIRSWTGGRGPRRHPFPRPGVRMPGRNLWRRKTVEKWKAEMDALERRDQELPDQPGASGL